MLLVDLATWNSLNVLFINHNALYQTWMRKTFTEHKH